MVKKLTGLVAGVYRIKEMEKRTKRLGGEGGKDEVVGDRLMKRLDRLVEDEAGRSGKEEGGKAKQRSIRGWERARELFNGGGKMTDEHLSTASRHLSGMKIEMDGKRKGGLFYVPVPE